MADMKIPPGVPVTTPDNAEKVRQRESLPPVERQNKKEISLDRQNNSGVKIKTPILSRRLKYSIDRELNQVIVKVIDAETEKIIKELPPEALQRLHRRIREAVALLVDEEA
ncbi:flagellar protein FlaG [Spirochaetia bacterium 38H-sp]|uniref:Flagellar protein FlaG n=1 Tax=Rarispira pelagica TaxID=3141764 RepID=A0ABU9UD10_9SPIR